MSRRHTADCGLRAGRGYCYSCSWCQQLRCGDVSGSRSWGRSGTTRPTVVKTPDLRPSLHNSCFVCGEAHCGRKLPTKYPSPAFQTLSFPSKRHLSCAYHYTANMPDANGSDSQLTTTRTCRRTLRGGFAGGCTCSTCIRARTRQPKVSKACLFAPHDSRMNFSIDT
jgi:hypothetical protein